MDMLKLHEEALQSTSTAYHEFLLRYKPNEAVVYGFVEGKEDPMFYRGLIERVLPAGWEVELIASGSRNNVLRSLAEFDWEQYSTKRICFFVDRDLTDFVETIASTAENLYVTDGYSIENEAMTFATFRRLLEEVFNTTGLQPKDVEVLRQLYEANLKIFHEALCPVMAQIILWQRSGMRAVLNNINIAPFFEFVNGRAGIRSSFASGNSRAIHAAHCVGLAPSMEPERLIVEQEFKDKQGLRKFIRGKYSLWFLVESVTRVHQSIGALIPAFKEPPKVKIAIGPKNAMVVLGPRIRCPESLRIFIQTRFVKFSESTGSSPAPERRSARPLLQRVRSLFRRFAVG